MADIGTGCGAIAVSLAVSLPEAEMTAVDISIDALAVALANCREHGVLDRVRLVHGDLLEPLDGQYDIIIANLPYVTSGDVRAMDTFGHEPVTALDGGEDGLDAFRRLVPAAGGRIRPGGFLLLETGMGQGDAVGGLLAAHCPGSSIEVLRDLAGIDRVVKAAFPER
jgi:release factor glutamine methyltransferase